MYPNGLVAAASMTSHTSTPMRSHSMAVSLTSAMFTLRKTFSRILVISATSGLETGTSESNARPYTATTLSVHRGVSPPTTFGVLRVVQSSRPGSTRSGEKAR